MNKYFEYFLIIVLTTIVILIILLLYFIFVKQNCDKFTRYQANELLNDMAEKGGCIYSPADNNFISYDVYKFNDFGW